MIPQRVDIGAVWVVAIGPSPACRQSMNACTRRVAREILRRYPDGMRAAVIAHKLANRCSPPALLDLLREAEAAVRVHGEAGGHARRHVQNEPEGADQ
jgi:hypothetical protein